LRVKKEEEKVAAAAAPDSRFAVGFSEEEVEEDDDDDDGDIFAQFTGGSSKKKEQFFKKKPQEKVEAVVAEVKAEVPLKEGLVIKLVEFNDEANGKKSHKELWKIEMDNGFRKKIVKCIASTRRFAFLIKELQ
jgi:hypothetical protein